MGYNRGKLSVTHPLRTSDKYNNEMCCWSHGYDIDNEHKHNNCKWYK